jgi:hypothetical protein
MVDGPTWFIVFLCNLYHVPGSDQFPISSLFTISYRIQIISFALRFVYAVLTAA